MRSFLRAMLLGLVLLSVTVALVFNFLLNRIARSEDFRRFAEKKVGEFLKATVHIGEIRPYRFTQLSLEKILIETPAAVGGSQILRVDRLLFRYQIDQLWTRKFDVPAGVVLRNPTILIEQDQFPYRYFENTPGGSAGFTMPSLDFKGGEIRYLLSSLGKEIRLRDVEGRIQPSLGGEARVDVRARMTGLMNGRVHIHGTVDPSRKTHDLWLELESTDFSGDIPLPFRSLNGKVRWAGQDLFFEDLQGTLYGWRTDLSGAFLNGEGHPKIAFHLRTGKGVPQSKLDLSLDFFSNGLEGSFEPFEGSAVNFRGKIRREKNRFFIDPLAMDSGYQARGELDFSSGNYELSFEKGYKRVAIHSNLRGLDFALNFRFEHATLWGMDLVTQGKLFLHTASLRWKGRDFLFKGKFETDYFILERQPFEDLRGEFEFSPLGVTGIRSFWGEKFRLTGQILFPDKKPKAKLAIHIANFDLSLVETFASKPLPKALGGILNGKLSLEGDLFKPEVYGVFNLHDGKWGQLNYDRGIIQLRGFLPYLPLRDSKIWKGRTVFHLTGALDLKLDNIFAGVKIQTPDNLVIWKGIEAVLHESDKSLEVNTSKLGRWGELSILEAKSTDRFRENRPEEAWDAEEEVGMTFGPKLKF